MYVTIFKNNENTANFFCNVSSKFQQRRPLLTSKKEFTTGFTVNTTPKFFKNTTKCCPSFSKLVVNLFTSSYIHVRATLRTTGSTSSSNSVENCQRRLMWSNGSNILDFSEVVFSAIVLLVSAGISSHFINGFNSKQWKTSFVGMILLMIVATQLHYLIQAALFIPTYPYMYDSSLLRVDCLDSGKGGKRSRDSVEDFDRNPCFNITNNATNITDSREFLSYERNCPGGFGGMCTETEPCDPCDREELPTWGSGRCRSCTAAFKGDCKFVPGVGPYCRESINSKKVIPCKRCCTESIPLFVNGTCY